MDGDDREQLEEDALGPFVAGICDTIVSSDPEIERAIESVRIELPLELRTEVDGERVDVRIVSGVQRTETTVLPVVHRIVVTFQASSH